MSTLQDKAHELQRLHAHPELLVLVNVWDAISAQVVADAPGTTALATASHAVADALAAGERAGIPFVLNARTDAFLRAADRDPAEVLADAIERGRAYLDAGASTFFAPG